MISESQALFALSLTQAISPKNIKLLREHFSSYKEILSMDHEKLQKLKILKKNYHYEGKKNLIDKANKIQIECEKLDVQSVTFECHHYPKFLKEIYLPPIVLYYKGFLPDYDYLKKPYLAIVGSRKSDQFVNDLTRRIAETFTQNGGHIVSGLAVGIDSYAHLGASKKGPNTAVLGCGLDYFYPYCNRRLYQEIIDAGGCLLSEYPPGTKPLPFHFPQRNRIISGLCSDVFMAQAPKKSGALITTTHAIEQNKNIYTFFPYDDKQEIFDGNRLILEQGATGIHDEFEFIQKIFNLPTPINPNAQKNLANLDQLDPQSRRIVECVKESPKNSSEISQIMKIAPCELISMLFELSLDGYLKELPGKKYYVA